MPRLLPPSELEQLLALIPADQDGLGIEAIARRLHKPLPRRTLQRRLALLVTQGRISRRGEARAVRYVRQTPAEGLLSVREAPAEPPLVHMAQPRLQARLQAFLQALLVLLLAHLSAEVGVHVEDDLGHVPLPRPDLGLVGTRDVAHHLFTEVGGHRDDL